MSDGSRRGFFAELKRRNVYRIALAYLVVAWLLIQIADTVFPNIGLPDRAITIVIVLTAIGFIPALVFAWAFEITPEGIKREEDIERSDSYTLSTARKMNVAIVSVLAVALAFFAVNRLVDGPVPNESSPEIVTTDRPSIAVLPFNNRSGREDDAYFVDGIHDDILMSIARIGSIRVISRTTVEQLRDTELTTPEIATMLGVQWILEGGVQRAGDRIRISVRLVDAIRDEQLWGEPFEEELTAENLFSIQSDIAANVAANMRTTLTLAEQDRLFAIPTRSLAAYEAYLLGNDRLKKRTGATCGDERASRWP